MPELWLPGAEIHDLGDHAPTDQQYPPKAIAHITWDRNATPSAPQDWCPFDDLVAYFTGAGAGDAPHIVWDPFSGRAAQLFPADSRSKSLLSPPASPTRTNRAGRVLIQIEAVFFPYCRHQGTVYARLVDTPCAGWDRLHAWIASWGVPDVWPMGRPIDFGSHRDEQVWETRGGWYAHAHVPYNDHTDPGSWPNFVGAPSSPPPPEPTPARYQVTINGLRYGYGAYGYQVTAVGRALVANGFGGHYQSGPGPDWTDADTENYADYQRSLGYSGPDADGVPGETSLRALLGYLPCPRTVSLAHAVSAARTDPGAEQGHRTYGAEVAIVEQALTDEGLLEQLWVDGSFGSMTVTAYAAWQRRCGYSDADADGIPGYDSLHRLGAAQDFTVTD
ncbi:peptidoglycan-binding protein [Streptomyces kaniharaensis]|uniref:Peptidoglycan-binding protein n=1 Tax=Streptomyces kaniharaensis TaxID=212423 RepID=A0A6N7KYJ8_9ACTN|nr:peptidoglycan-binding protein [Streptomyces kaniharaensis]MQS15437.1 peptidoglycan-binding protein [Streptomyces kaniharaensis]